MSLVEEQKILVTIGVVMYSIINGELSVLLIKRTREPYEGFWCLPGGYMENNKSADQTVAEKLRIKVGLKRVYLEEFAVFTKPDRDHRYRCITIAYMSIGEYHDIKTYSQYGDVQFHSINKLPQIAFDHVEIVRKSYEVLRAKVMHTNIAQFFLPRYFTLQQLQQVYDIILSTKSDVRNFRTMIDRLNIVRPTSKKETNVSHRPAVLYEFISKEINISDYQ